MPCIVSLCMVGHGIANFATAIVLKLLSPFVTTKGITIKTYFQSSSLCFVRTIIFFLCRDILSSTSLHSLSRYNFRSSDNVLLLFALSFVAINFQKITTFFLLFCLNWVAT